MPLKLTLKGAWNNFLNFLSPSRARMILQAEMRRKVNEQVQLLRRDVVKYINEQRHGVPNSPLTVLTKGSSKALIDRGDLRQSINAVTSVEGGRVIGACGVKRSARSKSGGKLVNISAALHEGFTVKVTPAVRAAVFAKMKERSKNRRKKLGPAALMTGGTGATVWVVRGRPFIREPFEAAETRIIMALGNGVRLTLKKL